MNDWGRRTYGDPCRGCAFDWSIEEVHAVRYVEGLAPRYRTLIGSNDGSGRHPDLRWSVAEYVCHVVDNLRIWAERLAAAAAGSRTPIAPYDADLLAQARRYDEVPIEGALWSLEAAARTWSEAVGAAKRSRASLEHPERGQLPVSSIVRTNCHDAHHHAWDIERSISAGGAQTRTDPE